MTDRARVPFALIGVLLLVTSGTVAVSQHDPVVTEPPVDREMDRLTAETQSALRSAVLQAARDAAAAPVTEPANTTVGRAINGTATFQDALRLRIYLAARDRLDRLAGRQRQVARSVSLPPIEDPDAVGDVRDAIERVHVERAGPADRQLRVRIEGVRLAASRGDGLGGEIRSAPSFVVDTPVLAIHDRVARFEARLNRPVGRPGLASRVTGVMYPVAWARGYAQYGGMPVENVVANRHVALATNGALLGEQRRAFGTSDPTGRWVYAGTLGEVALEDLTGVAESPALDRLAAARERTGLGSTTTERLDVMEPSPGAPDPSDTTNVSIGRTADRAYLEALAAKNETAAATYAPRVRVRANTETFDRDVRRRHDPGGGWERERQFVDYDTTVVNATGSPPASPAGWHRFLGASRTVHVVEREIRYYEKPDNTTGRTVRIENYTAHVDLAVEARHVVGPAPAGPIEVVHERGGPLDGPNLADAAGKIAVHVGRDRGGTDALAADAATGRLDTDARPVQADRPAGLAAWAGADLHALRREVRDISVTVPKGEVATLQRNVPAMLADRLRDRREAVVDPPERYDSVAHRARVGVRADYVDRVLAHLERRASQHDAAGEKLDDALPSISGSVTDVLATGYGSRSTATAGPAGPVGGDEDGLDMTVDASPAYLPVEAVGHDAVPAIPENRTEHALAVRNVNAVSVPSTGVIEGLLSILGSGAKSSLQAAAQTLKTSAAAGLRESGDSGAVGTLRDDVAYNSLHLQAAIDSTLEDADLGPDSRRADVIRAGLAPYNGTAGRAAALANGSAADSVHAAAVAAWPEKLGNATARERLAVELDLAVVERRNATGPRPAMSAVNATTDVVQRQLEAEVDRAVDRAATRVEDEAVSAVRKRVSRRTATIAAKLPSGVPLVPAPGTWYATVNAWHVQVRGTYARFAVRVPRGSPERVPPTLTYVRENRTATLDVAGDGEQARLGFNRRISFEAETAIAVAVPPGAQGVGDVDERDERSPGWPEPGPVEDPSGGNKTEIDTPVGDTPVGDTSGISVGAGA